MAVTVPDCDIENPRCWTVYIHTVPKEISGKQYDKHYIGITSIGVYKRWMNGCGYKGQVFYNAIVKYGWENIRHNIIADDLTEKEACALEKQKIREYNAQNKLHGYNIDAGGKKTSFFRKKHTEETRQLMSQNHCDVSGGNNPRAKRVHQFSIRGEYITSYDSARTAGKAIGSADGMGSAAIHGKPFMGFYWGHDEDIVIEEGNIKLKRWPLRPPCNKSIYKFTLDGIFIERFNTLTDAAASLNIHRQSLKRIIDGTQINKTGFIWKRHNDVVQSLENPEIFYCKKMEV